MKKSTILSFCIPTFNNINSLSRLVNQILINKSDLIEIVVLDNGSTDGTLKQISTIVDNRLRIYTNGDNKGALYNMVNVLNKGDGDFLIYITDHDHVIYEGIDNFIKFLENNASVACGYCEYNKKNVNENFQIFPSGVPSISKLAYITRHPTGYFFNRRLLHSINFIEKFSNFNYVDLFPLEFVFAELCILDSGAIYNSNFVFPETGDRVVEHKSATTNGNLSSAFFSPQTRLKLVINFENHIQTLSISNSSKIKLIIDSFFRELYNATFGFRYVMQNQKLCIHYKMSPQNIKYTNLIKIGHQFYINYSNFVLKKRYKNKIQIFFFKILLFKSLVIKILNKII
jgi:glycosyltransferase involved in cell wall biosynthesis